MFSLGGRNLPFIAGGVVVALVLVIALGLRRTSKISGNV
jgi:hypothetical protein